MPEPLKIEDAWGWLSPEMTGRTKLPLDSSLLRLVYLFVVSFGVLVRCSIWCTCSLFCLVYLLVVPFGVLVRCFVWCTCSLFHLVYLFVVSFGVLVRCFVWCTCSLFHLVHLFVVSFGALDSCLFLPSLLRSIHAMDTRIHVLQDSEALVHTLCYTSTLRC